MERDLALDPQGPWSQNGETMVPHPTTAPVSAMDAHDASLVNAVVVVVGLIISLLLVSQA